jgi:hypothetical protein
VFENQESNEQVQKLPTELLALLRDDIAIQKRGKSLEGINRI